MSDVALEIYKRLEEKRVLHFVYEIEPPAVSKAK